MAKHIGETIMPKIHGTNILGILAAAVGFFIIGFLWYGAIFMVQWRTLQGLPLDADPEVMTMVWGFLITLVQVIGINYILHQSGAKVLATCAKIAGIVGLLLGVPFAAYAMVYTGAPLELFMIDASHLLVGYVVAGAILSFFRGKDAVG